MNRGHVPVLLNETIQLLECKLGGAYLDCTAGQGGHLRRIAEAIGPNGLAIGIDQDPLALEMARDYTGNLPQVRLIHSNFSDLKKVLRELDVDGLDGVLFDLGVSSIQLEDEERGFSYNLDAPLDMRMNPHAGLTAAEVVNSYSREELQEIISRFGEERWAGRIAAFIVETRKRSPIRTTQDLVSIIKAAIPASARRKGGHPARKTFQALRIYVNRELEVLEKALRDAVDMLFPGGRIVVISFHSLEDRVVKHLFNELSGRCECPPELPQCSCPPPVLRILTRKPIIPTTAEIESNPRARSAKLRAALKL